MTRRPVFFSEAMTKAAAIAVGARVGGVRPLLIRDLRGKISIALNVNRKDHASEISRLESEIAQLHAFAGSMGVVCADDLFDAGEIFGDPAIVEVREGDFDVSLLDRQVTGQDWSMTRSSSGSSKPPRLVFYGLKGGVGRSTALAILAYELANKGKRVLLIDLDLESPGLSGLLIPPEHLADFGVADWLVEDAVGQGDEVIGRMVRDSPISRDLRSPIRVAAAAGKGDGGYIEKLSRVYGDITVSGRPRRFTERIRQLVERLEAEEKPDVVLIDSRAGLHDLAALSIVGLASTALLFATHSEQTWQGYGTLFGYWQNRPKVVRGVRDRLKMVDALFPETEQAIRSAQFLDRSYRLFTERLYDPIKAGETGEDAFNYTLNESTGPHFPLRILWNRRFQEFNPLEPSVLDHDSIRAAYGNFIDGAEQLIKGEEE